MARLALLLVTVASTAVLAASASASAPPLLVSFAATHARPVAGKPFTGITAINLGTQLTGMKCEAKIGHKLIEGRARRYYSFNISGPAAISCTWKIPAGSRGKVLRAWDVAAFTADGSVIGAGIAPVWRIR